MHDAVRPRRLERELRDTARSLLRQIADEANAEKTIMRHLTIAVLLWAGVSACASTPGPAPRDMTVAEHDALANQQAQESAARLAQDDPKPETATRRCTFAPGILATAGLQQSCWSESENPTSEHRDDVEMHKKLAAEHRARSQALRDAEGSACLEISADDRDMSPFHHREDIVSVEPLTERGGAKSTTTSVAGAIVVFRAVPGMTTQWLQRIVDCHLARDAALGHVVPELAYCPLVPEGVVARVSAHPNGLAVEMRSDNPTAATEVLRRAQALRWHSLQ